MRKRNSVKQLNRPQNQRKAMLQSLVTALFYHERIETTLARAKAIKSITEKIITRAKRNQNDQLNSAEKVHNIRIIEKFIKNKEILNKIFDDIAPRYKERNGGYTRVLRISNRVSDNSEMGLIELIDRKETVELKEERKNLRESQRKKNKDAKKEKSK